MVSIFHLNGEKLMMTHYCFAGNQPRMHVAFKPGKIGELDFTFVDATNLYKPSDGHMRGLKFTFDDKDRLIQVWTWRENGKDLPATFSLTRMK